MRIQKKTLWRGGIVLLVIVALIGIARSDRVNEYIGQRFASRFFSSQFALGKVLSIQEGTTHVYNTDFPYQLLNVQILSGPDMGTTTVVKDQGSIVADLSQKIRVGEVITLNKNIDFQGDDYYMNDRFRILPLLVILLLFVLAIVYFGRTRGFTSLLGLALTAVILVKFMIPQILKGGNPLFVIFLGAFVIAVVSLYLAHGFNKRTSIAVVGTLITLILSLGMAVFFSYLARLIGAYSEDAFYLKLSIGNLSLEGLFLGSILIGALGVLDDVTVGQATTVEELSKANPELDHAELYHRGSAVGREHIASLVNTLVLAYAGVSFPLILLFIINKSIAPYWAILNGEQIAEEIVRTVVGSLGLILAVPITTFLAARFYGKKDSGAK